MKYWIVGLVILIGCAANPSPHHSPPREDSGACPDSGVVMMEDSSVVVDSSVEEDSSVVMDSAMEDSGMCPLGCVPAADYICYHDPSEGCYYEWLDLYTCSLGGDCGNNQCGRLWDCIIWHNLPPHDLTANCDW